MYTKSDSHFSKLILSLSIPYEESRQTLSLRRLHFEWDLVGALSQSRSPRTRNMLREISHIKNPITTSTNWIYHLIFSIPCGKSQQKLAPFYWSYVKRRQGRKLCRPQIDLASKDLHVWIEQREWPPFLQVDLPSMCTARRTTLTTWSSSFPPSNDLPMMNLMKCIGERRNAKTALSDWDCLIQ